MRAPRAIEIVTIIALAAVVFTLLAGCATSTPAPPPITAGVTTTPPQRIPVLVPCLTANQVPPPPPTHMNPSGDGWHNDIASGIDLKNLDDYVVTSQSLMLGCVKAFEQEKTK